MSLRHFTNIAALSTALVAAVPASADTTSYHYVHSRYRAEYCSWFEFTTLDRGFDIDSTRMDLDFLASKPRKIWTRSDSLLFARTSLRAGDPQLAKHYFNKLDVSIQNDPGYWWDELMMLYSLNRFEEAEDHIHETNEGILEGSELYFLHKLLDAEFEQAKDSKWSRQNSLFHWQVDTTLSPLDKTEFAESVQQPLHNLDAVLSRIVRHVHEDDPVLSKAFSETGDILAGYQSWSQAYIAYSVSRHYNKRDKETLSKIKSVKAELVKRQYKIPNFRKYFPRTEYYRFDYDVLKEHYGPQATDSTLYIKPVYRTEKEAEILPFKVEFIYVGGLGLMFLLIFIFVRSSSKQKRKTTLNS